MIEIPEAKKNYWNKEIVSVLEIIRKEDCVPTKNKIEQTDSDVIVLDSTQILSAYSFEYDSENNIRATYTKGRINYIIEKNGWKIYRYQKKLNMELENRLSILLSSSLIHLLGTVKGQQ